MRASGALVFVALLSLFTADFSAGCGHGYVFGTVTEKYARTGDNEYLIGVNGTAYAVPIEFYNTVRVGQTVRYDGTKWVIVPAATPPSNPRPIVKGAT